MEKKTDFYWYLGMVGFIVIGIGLLVGLSLEVFYAYKTFKLELGIGYFFDMSKIAGIIAGVIMAIGAAIFRYAERKRYGFNMPY